MIVVSFPGVITTNCMDASYLIKIQEQNTGKWNKYNRVRKPYLSDVSIIVYTKYSVFHLRENGDEWVCTDHIRERGPQRPGF